MATTVYHVVPHDERWAVRKASSEHNSRVADTKDEAVEIARGFAKNQTPSRLVIHDENGRIEEQRAYATPDEADDDGGSGGGWSVFDRDHLPEPSTAAVILGAVAVGLTVSGLVYWMDKQNEKKKAAARRRRAMGRRPVPDTRDMRRHDKPGILNDPVESMSHGNDTTRPGNASVTVDPDATDPPDPNDPTNYRD